MQHDSMQCGIACLQMICKFYGLNIGFNRLSDLCFATTEGMSLLGINLAAKELGFHSVCSKVSIELVKQAALPCILHWNQNHFVVLYRIRREKATKFYIADPGKGLLVYKEKDLIQHWISIQSDGEEKGIALFLRPTPEFYQQQEEQIKKNKRSFSFLFSYIKQYRRYFMQIIIGLLVVCVLQLIFPFLTQAIVDVGIRQKEDRKSTRLNSSHLA